MTRMLKVGMWIFFFFLHMLLFENKAKPSKKTFRAVYLLKWVTSKNSVTLRHFQTWPKNGTADLQVVNYWASVSTTTIASSFACVLSSVSTYNLGQNCWQNCILRQHFSKNRSCTGSSPFPLPWKQCCIQKKAWYLGVCGKQHWIEVRGFLAAKASFWK